MKSIFSLRLRNARKMRGLSMDELVKSMNGLVSKQAISKYERGQMMPGSQVLLSLSKVLALPVDYFFRESINIGKISFREDYHLPIREADRLIAMAQDKLERYLLLEDLLAITGEFFNPLASFLIATYADVEQAADALRNAWQLGIYTLPSVYDILERMGIKVLEFEVNESTVLGFSSKARESVPFVVVNMSANATVERKRFTALHELGHLLLNFKPGLSANQRERMCHRFAAAMLCPQRQIAWELGEKRTALTLAELTSLKSRYGISVAALVHRAKDLGIITDAYYNHIFDTLIHQNPMEEGWGAYLITEHTDRFEHLLQRAVVEEIISMSRAAELAGEPLGEYREKIDAL